MHYNRIEYLESKNSDLEAKVKGLRQDKERLIDALQIVCDWDRKQAKYTGLEFGVIEKVRNVLFQMDQKKEKKV